MSVCIRTLCLSITACAVLSGQTEVTSPPTKGFTVAVLRGDGVLNPLPRPPITQLSIRVNDSKGTAIRNAVAIFELPEQGASATFLDGSIVKVLLTNDKGEAIVDTKSNDVPGKFQPTITINYLGQSSLVRLNQENAFPYAAAAGAPPPATHRRFLNKIFHKPTFLTTKVVLIIAAVAVAVVTATLIARRHSTTTPPGGITVTPGTGTVGK